MSSIINLCKDGGKGMSPCTKAGEGSAKQDICSFYEKSSIANRCMYEIFGDFCDRVAAQKHSKGQPILMSELNGDEFLDHPTDPPPMRQWGETVQKYIDNSGTVDRETLDEVTEVIKQMKHNGISIREEKCCTDIHNHHALYDPLDEHGIPYIDSETGDVRIARSANQLKMKTMKDPCLRCSIGHSKSGCSPCRMKDKYNLEMDKLTEHEMIHRIVTNNWELSDKEGNGVPYLDPDSGEVKFARKEYPVHCVDHNHQMIEEPLPHGHYAMTVRKERSSHDHEHLYYHERDSYHETDWYLHSRRLRQSAIMERFNAGLMIVVSAKTPGMPENIFTRHESLLFDTEYLVLYDQFGKVALQASRHLLHYVIYDWRKKVPKDALPKYKDYAIFTDFGFGRAVSRFS